MYIYIYNYHYYYYYCYYYYYYCYIYIISIHIGYHDIPMISPHFFAHLWIHPSPASRRTRSIWSSPASCGSSAVCTRWPACDATRRRSSLTQENALWMICKWMGGSSIHGRISYKWEDHPGIWGGSIKGWYPNSWMVYVMENPMNMDDSGVPLFYQTSI